MTSNVVEIFQPDGDVRRYEKLSSRLPRFLEEYSPREGWRVITRPTDPLSMKPGLLTLYQAAVAAGKKPEDVGLPKIEVGNIAVFEAQLVSPEGKVVQTAHALAVIQSHKDLEICETAARQRLVAACGYDGALLDENEAQDILRQGLATGESRSDSKPAMPSRAAQTQASPARPEAKHAPALKSPSSGRGPRQPGARPDRTAVALGGLRNQIASQARNLGVDAPEVTSLDEARMVLRDLIKRGQRKSAGSR